MLQRDSSFGHAGSHAGLNRNARQPANGLLGGKRDRDEDADDMAFIEDDVDGGDGDWRTMLRAVTGGYDPSKCAPNVAMVSAAWMQ